MSMWFVTFQRQQHKRNPLQLGFFFFLIIIATNWKTIHHINIITVSQKMENKIKQHLYIFFFCHGIGRR